jgi:hypothetical protein
MVPFLNARQYVFGGIRILLDDDSGPPPRPRRIEVRLLAPFR